MPNVERPEFDQEREHAGYRARRAFLGRQAGAERLGASLWELPPGEAAYPYHWHLIEEELIVVLSGTPALRTPEGWRDLEPGEVVSFLPGEPGGHQLVNRTSEPVRFLAISTNPGQDVAIYPDTGKIGIFEKPDGIYELYRRAGAVGYWDDVEPPGS